MIITRYKEGILLEDEWISPEKTFNCGQCFRFYSEEEGFCGIAHGRILHVRKTEKGLYLFPVPAEDESLWADYFDAETDYRAVSEKFSHDPVMREAAAAAEGIRLLNQDPFETIITFIVSANNNIPRIRSIIEKICRACGTELCGGMYAFPTPEQLCTLAPGQLRELGAGYRAEYIADTAAFIACGEDLHRYYEMDYKTAKKQLCGLKGIGPKVADCILLFAYKKKEAFPVDVWLKRCLGELYRFDPKNDKESEAFALERYGEYAGIAQQFLFYYMRTR